MPDINPDDVPSPIVVNASAVPDQASAALRDIVLVLSAVPTVMAFIGKGDMMGLVSWMSSTAAAPVMGVLATAAVVIWRQWNARHRNAVSVKLASAAPDSIAVVK
jgi:hypothetical protein